MKNNSSLNKAKDEKFDEFYAIPAEIAKELNHYRYEFKGKTIFCNCNDGLHRGFVDFFKENFDDFEIDLLIYSTYGEDDKNGEIFTYNGIYEKSKKLKTKGDFRIGECLDALKYADIIVTGPPFSLFREFINLMFTHNKKFLVIGDFNSVVCKDIFPHMINGDIQFGFTNPYEFIVPDRYKGNCFVDKKDGLRKTRLGKTVWYTNIKHNTIRKPIPLTAKYSPKKYPKCDNFDAIWVENIKDIPKDYNGIMCVPISYLQKHCELQFEILGLADNNKIVEPYRIEGHRDYTRPYVKGERKIYRVLIRRINASHKCISQLTPQEKNIFINKIIFLMEKYRFQELENLYYGNKNIHQEYEWCLRAMRKLGFKFRHIMNMFNPTEDDYMMMEMQEFIH